ncbi:MAG: tripartite tricarboxylate transporter substrate binding protein [Betaproteobacteria bacterium]|nr:tripartite tricarboxylate transporter substrate binding protein [Betaproteobacteria bacterium]
MPLFVTIAVALLAAGAALSGAYAQSYPAKPVRFIIPFPPGGPTDLMGRLAAARLTKAWGVQVVPDNRGGAGGNIGSDLCAKSPPDGYTICMFTVAQSISPAIYRKLPFDPMRDFSPVTLMAILPSMLTAHPALPAKTVKELVALAKSQPGQLTYASTGNGTSPHMLMEMFKSMAGINMVHVPYKGQAPSVDEGGVKGFDGSSWQAVVMPAGTPRDIVSKVHQELAGMLKSAEIRQRFLAQGALASGITPDEFSAFLKRELDKWAKVARAANVKVD